ncbi:hypothetical protein [Aureibacillus halotolerans]|uniref:YolD-like protein n=1 Tax=Aureibacillus halotolerans TaxID=1508390 RepID=A0A4V3D4H6_9BACI|nr:hypothetical protein [Aureibacillus halotolerans]TDQ36257.1 hypothetical protein EV213_11946 [Aureibacillus halotolerans]
MYRSLPKESSQPETCAECLLPYLVAASPLLSQETIQSHYWLILQAIHADEALQITYYLHGVYLTKSGMPKRIDGATGRLLIGKEWVTVAHIIRMTRR